MHSLAILPLAALLALALSIDAQEHVSTEIVYALVGPESTLSPIATKTSLQQASSTPSTSSTSTQASSTTLSTSALEPSSTQIAAAPATPTSSDSSNHSGYGSEPDPNAVNTSDGASGSDNSSFNLSKGALAAIITVVILVAVFGIASTVLFVVAKRRQWRIRESVRRVSRRLTGRDPGPKTPRTAQVDRRSKRAGLRIGSPARPATGRGDTSGHKRGLLVQQRDIEKGPLDHKAPTNTRPRERKWMGRLWGSDWK